MLPSLHLDTALGRRRKMQEPREESVPGCFSPRPTHARSLSEWQSSPERESSPEGFARTAANRPSQPRDRALRRSPPKATLLEHQKARSAAPTQTPRRAPIAVRFAPPAARPSLCAGYVSGRQWAARRSLPARMAAVSALATSASGEHVAIGDASGRLLVMRRGDTQGGHEGGKMAQEEGRADTRKPRVGTGNGGGRGCRVGALRDAYHFVVGRQAYTSVIDPLNSVEVTPNIQALCFLPQASPTTYLLTANEKMPKLYKVIDVRESPAPFSAMERLGATSVGSLTLSPLHGISTTTMKQVTRYALNHEYNINSLCPLPDSQQFFSADDLTVKLWCIEYPDTSIETYSLKPPFDEEPRESICGIRSFPHEPFLLFVMTSSGTVRVVDTRQTLRWLHQVPLVFNNSSNNSQEEDTLLTNSLSDCALSPCGRYVAGRDLMSVCLWDIRHANLRERTSRTASLSSSFVRDEEHDVVQRWDLYPQLRQELLEQVYQMESLGRFSLRFLNSREIATGGFAGMLYVLDTLEDIESSNNPSSGRGQMSFELPQLNEECDLPLGPIPSFKMDEIDYMSTDPDVLFGSVVTQLSQPLTSVSGECSVFASCGPAVFQLSYTCK